MPGGPIAVREIAAPGLPAFDGLWGCVKLLRTQGGCGPPTAFENHGVILAKQITVCCPVQVADVIIQALQWFVESHYPYCADECSTAAREALLDLIGRFQRELRVEGCCQYSRRIRAFVCEAVNGYSALVEQQSGKSYTHRRDLVIKVCRGQSDGTDFSDAAALDSAGDARGAV